MKITDESMAKAFGWKRHLTVIAGHRVTVIERGEERQSFAPAYTSSLDAIVAEIEARGMGWNCSSDDSEERKGCWAQIGGHPSHHFAKTAPLALCAATLAYLKDKS